MPRRILVLSASVGAGHLRAAEAVELALRRLDPTAVVQNLDVLDFTNAAFRQLYGRAYLDLVNRAPTRWDTSTICSIAFPRHSTRATACDCWSRR